MTFDPETANRHERQEGVKVDRRTMDMLVEGIKENERQLLELAESMAICSDVSVEEAEKCIGEVLAAHDRELLEGTGGPEPTGLINPKPKRPRMQLGPNIEAVPNRHERRLHNKRLRLAIKKAFRETQHERKVKEA